MVIVSTVGSSHQVPTEESATVAVTHRTSLCVVRSVGQDEGRGLESTRAAGRAEGGVATAGQDHEEMCRDGSLLPGETGKHSSCFSLFCYYFLLMMFAEKTTKCFHLRS